MRVPVPKDDRISGYTALRSSLPPVRDPRYDKYLPDSLMFPWPFNRVLDSERVDGSGCTQGCKMGKEMYCSQCDERREVRVTVPWQADFCSVCGTDIDE